MFETVLRNLDFSHFASGAHKIAFADLAQSGDAVLLDVRAPEERSAFTLSLQSVGIEVLHIPIDELPDRLQEVPRDRLIGVFCPTVVRSSIAYAHLLSLGFPRVRILDGGYPALAGELLPGRLHAHRNRLTTTPG
ncbi:MAG: rhodanese-like domain-containing protein [Coriobacteriia bacterium]|nr:rhodanese-like domain-containing protein [Coriobacteriia bacterium]